MARRRYWRGSIATVAPAARPHAYDDAIVNVVRRYRVPPAMPDGHTRKVDRLCLWRHLRAVAHPGHASVTVMRRVYAHLAPEAWQQDTHRLAFHVPSEPARIYEVRRDERGKLAGRSVVAAAAAQ